MENQKIEFVELVEHPDYEIMTVFPFIIRKKSNLLEIKEGFRSKSSYIRVVLNRKSYNKHVLIAKQFIPNPNNYKEIDHINRDTTDYHIENLRWVSKSTNCRNKSSIKNVNYEFVDKLPSDALIVSVYNTRNGSHNFDKYYFHDDTFYYYTDFQYRKLHYNEDKNHYRYVYMIDIDNKRVAVCYSKFKRDYGLN